MKLGPEPAPRFVLIHSPSVGPSTWQPVAESLRRLGFASVVPSLLGVERERPPFWPGITRRVQDAVQRISAHDVVILVAHSNAGLFLPTIAEGLTRAVGGLIFVDAAVPPDEGQADVVPAELLEELRAKAVDGLLPRWTDWWPEEDVSALFADAETRRRVTDEQPHLPLAYYEGRIPVPSGWTAHPAAYLLFGPPYGDLAAAAQQRGWPVLHVPGGHLHLVVDPDAVADALVELAGRL